MQQQQFARAAEEFKKVLALDPTLIEAEVNLGLAYQSLFDYNLAVQHLTKGLRQRPDLLGPNVIAGMDYLKLGSPEKAIPFLQQALKLDPSNRDARQALASSYLALNNFGNAAEQFRQIAGLDPDKAEAWFKLGHEYLDLAAHLAYRGAHLYPESPWGHRFLGDLFFQRARWEDAIKEYQKALASDPQQPGLHTSLGQAYLQAHKPEQAEAEFRLEHQQARTGQSASDRLQLGKEQFEKHQYESAAEVLAQVQGVNKENDEASYWLAKTYQALGADLYVRLQESFPDSWRTYQLRGEGDALRGDVDNAAKEFQTALQLRPNEPELHEALGELYLENHMDDASEKELERAATLDPSRAHTLYLLGRLFVQNRETEKALPCLQRALRLQPDLVEASSLLGTVYVRMGQFADAIQTLEKAAVSDHYGNVHYQLYVAYRKLGKSELAQKELARSQELRRGYLERDEALIMGSPQPAPDPQ